MLPRSINYIFLCVFEKYPVSKLLHVCKDNRESGGANPAAGDRGRSSFEMAQKCCFLTKTAGLNLGGSNWAEIFNLVSDSANVLLAQRIDTT